MPRLFHCGLRVLFPLCALLVPASAQVINTVAGTTWTFRGDGRPAVEAPLGTLFGVAVDSSGNFYASDSDNHLVVKISPSGVLTVIAGNGIFGYSGDGGPATSARVWSPRGVAVDGSGNVYIADYTNLRIRKVSTSGIISTVAGGGTSSGPLADGGPATSAQLSFPSNVAVDTAGNLYISDGFSFRVRKVSPAGIITTVAGNGTSTVSGDGGPATSAGIGSFPTGLAADAAGNLYFASLSCSCVRKVSASGIITRVAGGGSSSSDGGQATNASLTSPEGVAVDASGNLYIAESFGNRVRKVSAAGIITTVAGNGTTGFSGDGGPAINASLYSAKGVAADAAGNVYVADSSNRRIRKVSSNGVINTVAGNGLYQASGDGGPATSASLAGPNGLAVDAAGNLYIADKDNQRIRKVSAAGVISTVAGTGVRGFSGDGGQAINASFRDPLDVAVDAAGALYIADSNNNRVRKVSPSGIITALGSFSNPRGVAVDAAGNVYVSEFSQVRKISSSGAISTFAGGGSVLGDGGPATSAKLIIPEGLTLDASGNLYIADSSDNRIRKVSPGGIITTVAGNGSFGSSGDGGQATSVSMTSPGDVAVDAAGNLYIAETGANRIRKVDPSGIISTIAGEIFLGFSGDGGLASKARLGRPEGVVVDPAGNLYIADTFNSRIRKVSAVAPSFSATPSNLSFSTEAGSALVTSQSVALNGSVFGLAWSATARTQNGGSWLTVSPTSGQMPGNISVSTTALNLVSGTYHGSVEISVPVAVPSVTTIAVTLTVAPGRPPQLALERAAIGFETQAGSGNPSVQTLRISNAGQGALAWTAQTANSGNWLTVAPASGSASAGSPSTLQVTANVAGLAAGVYSGSVAISAASINQTETVAVTLLISQVRQTILLSRTGLTITGVEGGGAAPAETIGVLNTGQGTMSWTASASTLSGGSWLSVSPASGDSAARSLQVPLVEARVNLSGLRAGQYSGLIAVSATGAINSPQFVTVDLNVLPAGTNPGVLVRPTGMIFAARTGAGSPSSQLIRLATAAPGSVELIGAPFTFSGGDWLNAVPRNAVVSASDPRAITVQPDLGTLAPGVYRAALTLGFLDGSPARAVDVLFLVVGDGQSADMARSPGVGANCGAQKLFAVHRSLGSNFIAPAALPATIEVHVVDDCGNPVDNATVVASFSNGDPSLALAGLGSGIYSGTWRPVTPASLVAVKLRADLPPLTAVEVTAQGQVSGNPQAPALFSGGIVNAACFGPCGAVAPGGIISVFGRNLAGAAAGASSLPLPTTLAGATLTIGGIDAPLYFSSAAQINAQLPFESTPNSQLQVLVRRAGISTTVPETITVAAARPGIFTLNQDGKGQGVILLGDRLADQSAPARAGDVVVVYSTGLGATQPPVPSGHPALANPLSQVTTAVTATVGGVPAPVQFAGLTPGLVGLYQVNVQIPTGVSPGPTTALVLFQNGVPSNAVTLAIR